MTFSIDLRIEVFHPMIPGTINKDTMQLCVGAIPMSAGFPADQYRPFIETVPAPQRDQAIARVVKATIEGVLQQNEDQKTKG